MSRTRNLLAALIGLALLAACSSAPAPATLTQNGGTTGGTQAPGTTGSGTTGSSGTAPGTTGTTGTTGGAGTSGTTGTGGSGSGSTGSGSTSGTSTTGTTGGTSTTGGSSGGTTGIDTGRFAASALFRPDEERIGMTDTKLQMCAHAALTYGQAFGTKEADFNVFWEALNKEHGGIYGRQVIVNFKNDDYKATTAVQAATDCKATPGGIFMLLGGIGFDQIPAVRNWAEINRMLYVHHTATINGTQGQRFSFSELPTVERVGEAFAQLALTKYKGSSIGIIGRNSDNWRPGPKAFKSYGVPRGLKVVKEVEVANNAGSYAVEIQAMKDAKVDVVWGWVNALEGVQLLKQAKLDNYNPHWLLFPFNLTSQTLEQDALNPVLDGVAMYPAYSYKDYSGKFGAYADDMKEFERQYAKYDSGIDLKGIGGDLLFLNWVGQKALAVQLTQCGRDCTRDKFIDVLHSYHGQVPSSSACAIDFSGDGYHGSDRLNFMQTYASPSGKVNWRNTNLCVGRP